MCAECSHEILTWHAQSFYQISATTCYHAWHPLTAVNSEVGMTRSSVLAEKVEYLKGTALWSMWLLTKIQQWTYGGTISVHDSPPLADSKKKVNPGPSNRVIA